MADETDSQSESLDDLLIRSRQQLEQIRRMQDYADSSSSVTDESVFRLPLEPDLGAMQSGHFQPVTGTGARSLQSQGDMLLFDMRGPRNYVEEAVSMPKITSHLNSIPDTVVHEFPKCIGGRRVFVLGCKGEKYLLIKSETRVCCLRIRETSSVGTITRDLRQISLGSSRSDEVRLPVHHPYGLIPAFDTSPRLSHLWNGCTNIHVFFEKTRVMIPDIMKLPSLAMVELVVVIRVLWRIHYRYKLFCDKRYFVDGTNTDTLKGIKQRFLDRCFAIKEADAVSTDCIWFTQKGKQVTESVLKQTFHRMKKYIRSLDEFDRFNRDDDSIMQICPDIDSGQICVDVFVHFQPADAVCVEIAYPGLNTQKNLRELCVVPPEISARGLREEVSKIVRKEPSSVKLSVGGKELGSRLDLHQALHAPNCKITVKLKRKMTLTVHLMWKSDDEREKNKSISVYPYDQVAALKTELSHQVGIQRNMIDLYFDDHLLADHCILKESRIHDEDELEAHVFPYRRMVSVRTPSRQWCQVLVDNCLTSTVGEIKSLLQNSGAFQHIVSNELNAIANGRVVFDTEILNDLGTRPRIILVEAENLSYTAASSHNRSFVVFETMEEGPWFRQRLVMYDGESMFAGPSLNQREAEAKLRDMQEKRRMKSSAQPVVPVPGMQIMPSHQQVLAAEQLSAVSVSSISSSSSDASAASTVKLELEGKATAAHHVPRETTPKAGASPCRSPSQKNKRKSSTVQFHIGNTVLDSESLAVGQSTAMEESPPQLKRDSTEQEDNNAVLTQENLISDCGKSESSERSASCPILTVVSKSSSIAKCHSEMSISRRTTLSESCVENLDGRITISHSIHSEASMSPELGRQLVERMANSPPLASYTFAFGGIGGQSDASRDQYSQTILDDPAKTSMKKLLWFIAKQLGKNGLFVIRALGVAEDTIQQAEEDYPKNVVEKYHACLMDWYKRKGAEANKDTLKKALEDGDRRDLMEQVDEWYTQITSPSTSSNCEEVGEEEMST